jgi:hypothetical protein
MGKMKFSKIVFYVAGIYGLLVLLPQYFLEDKNGRDYPPAINHPEYYYGFIGVAVAFQVVFLVIASNPAGYRAMMIPSVIEKFSFGMAAIVLFLQGRLPAITLGLGILDTVLGVLFIVAFLKTAPKEINIGRAGHPAG